MRRAWHLQAEVDMHNPLIHRLLVPIDFRQASLAALLAAREFVPQAAIQLLHVLPPIDLVTGNVLALAAQSMTAKQAALEKLHRAAGAETKVSFDVRFGDAAEQIIAVADDWSADLIVMPAHSHGAFERALLGSVTERVLRGARCPVLTCPVAADQPSRRA